MHAMSQLVCAVSHLSLIEAQHKDSYCSAFSTAPDSTWLHSAGKSFLFQFFSAWLVVTKLDDWALPTPAVSQ